MQVYIGVVYVADLKQVQRLTLYLDPSNVRGNLTGAQLNQ